MLELIGAHTLNICRRKLRNVSFHMYGKGQRVKVSDSVYAVCKN